MDADWYVESVDTWGENPNGIHAFSGNFYGNGYTIRNLLLPGGTIHYIGLFGFISETLIQDLQLELGNNAISVTNSTGQRIGPIAGANKNSIIRNCGVYSSSAFIVNGANNYALKVGGISAGIYNENVFTTIENCYVSMDITITNGGTHIHASGITENCNIVRNCYYVGNITGIGWGADLLGVSFGVNNVQNSYSIGSLINNGTSSTYTSASGIGANDTSQSISNCVALINEIYNPYTSDFARVTNSSHSIFTNNYAYSGMLLNGAAVTSSDANSKNGLDKTAAELKQQSTYETGLGWDFDTVWEMGPATYPFPILKWQKGVVKLPPGFSVIQDALDEDFFEYSINFRNITTLPSEWSAAPDAVIRYQQMNDTGSDLQGISLSQTITDGWQEIWTILDYPYDTVSKIVIDAKCMRNGGYQEYGLRTIELYYSDKNWTSTSQNWYWHVSVNGGDTYNSGAKAWWVIPGSSSWSSTRTVNTPYRISYGKAGFEDSYITEAQEFIYNSITTFDYGNQTIHTSVEDISIPMNNARYNFPAKMDVSDPSRCLRIRICPYTWGTGCVVTVEKINVKIYP